MAEEAREQLTQEDALDLVKPTRQAPEAEDAEQAPAEGGAEAPTEQAGSEAATTEGGEGGEGGEEQESKVDWEEQSEAYEARIAELEAELQKERTEDFQKKLEQMPEEERPQAKADFYESLYQEQRMSETRNRLARSHPRARALFGMVDDVVQITVDEPGELEQIYEAADEKFGNFVSQLEKRIRQEVEAEYQESWGDNTRLGRSEPGSSRREPRPASAGEYDEAFERAKKSPSDVDAMAAFIASKGKRKGSVK